jgi:hypothetical protein
VPSPCLFARERGCGWSVCRAFFFVMFWGLVGQALYWESAGIVLCVCERESVRVCVVCVVCVCLCVLYVW